MLVATRESWPWHVGRGLGVASAAVGLVATPFVVAIAVREGGVPLEESFQLAYAPAAILAGLLVALVARLQLRRVVFHEDHIQVDRGLLPRVERVEWGSITGFDAEAGDEVVLRRGEAPEVRVPIASEESRSALLALLAGMKVPQVVDEPWDPEGPIVFVRGTPLQFYGLWSIASLGLIGGITLGGTVLSAGPAALLSGHVPEGRLFLSIGVVGIVAGALCGVAALRRRGTVELSDAGVFDTERLRGLGPAMMLWSEFRGYRDSESGHVVLLRQDRLRAPGGVPIPTRRERDRVAVLALLDRKGVPRVE